jgi:hypothetical protein
VGGVSDADGGFNSTPFCNHNAASGSEIPPTICVMGSA